MASHATRNSHFPDPSAEPIIRLKARPKAGLARSLSRCSGLCSGFVVAFVVGFMLNIQRLRRSHYATTAKTTLLRMCACVRVIARGMCALWRSGVVAFIYLIEKKEEKEGPTHYAAHYAHFSAVVASLNPLKSKEKGGI